MPRRDANASASQFRSSVFAPPAARGLRIQRMRTGRSPLSIRALNRRVNMHGLQLVCAPGRRCAFVFLGFSGPGGRCVASSLFGAARDVA